MKLFALANEKSENADRVIHVPYGRWGYGTKRTGDGRLVYFEQELDARGAAAIIASLAAMKGRGEKGIPVYWGHPDVPELAHKYPDKRAKGWIVSGRDAGGALDLDVNWLGERPTEGFGWFSPYWTGEVEELGNGSALMTVNDIRSVALVNDPNINEFRLANELQDVDKPNTKKGNTIMDREKLILALGLPGTATDEEILGAIEKNRTDAEGAAAAEAKASAAESEKADAETRREAAEAETKAAADECAKVREELANERRARRALLLDQAIAEGRISVAGRAAWEKRLADDFAAGSLALANERPLKTEHVEVNPGRSGKLDYVALANEKMAKNPGMSYTTAFCAVMREHPENK